MFVVDAVDSSLEVGNMALGFAHILVVVVLENDNALEVGFMEVGDGCVAHCAGMLVHVFEDSVLVEGVLNDDHDGHDRDCNDHARRLISDVWKLFAVRHIDLR